MLLRIIVFRNHSKHMVLVLDPDSICYWLHWDFEQKKKLYRKNHNSESSRWAVPVTVKLLHSQGGVFSPELVSELCVWSPAAAKGTVGICYRRSWITEAGEFFCLVWLYSVLWASKMDYFLRSATDSLSTLDRDGCCHSSITTCDTGACGTRGS